MTVIFFSFLIGLFVTLVLVPPLMRLAVPLKLTDIPDSRKVHLNVVPRCGGIAMSVGTLIPMVMWLPIDRRIGSLLAGGAIIVLFGIWDDRKNLKYQWKLAGQLIAVIVVMQGGFVLQHLPFAGLDPVSPFISYPITALFLLAITNAVNMTDGLDGLAAGCALLTLALIALLGAQGGGHEVVVIAIALMGSLVGFLRYNTHPAIVFMGDAGSQLLGFAIAVLTIYLLEFVHGALSPALPLLFLALPILDLLWVVSERLLARRSPFRPDRSHFHHKLLHIGFRHGEAVALVYLFHGTMVILALVLKYYSDTVVFTVLALFAVFVVGAFYWAKARDWTPQVVLGGDIRSFHKNRAWLDNLTWLSVAMTRGIAGAIGLFLIGGAVLAREVPMDVSVVSFALVAVLILAAGLLRPWTGTFTRIGLYVASVLIVSLITSNSDNFGIADQVVDLFFGLILADMAVFYYLNRSDFFRVTPQDLLVLLFAVVIPNLSPEILGEIPVGRFTFRLIILFYAVELLLNPSNSARDVQSYRLFRIAAPLSLLIIGFKGFVL